ncbi:hypothetical protein DICVIV_03469 [Dictyocaulus viviparus]|uniref:Uncharacterized protein n=1 Tax=Dictyocaulus viviparus TaxID=29172 RepID=A0A0D8Y2Z4_DICVI|nr:hypothetical protein DICVIV_03469 [Dictyocaulus viviparus]
MAIGLSRRKNKGASRFQHALPIFTPPEQDGYLTGPRIINARSILKVNTTKLTTNEVNTNGMSRVRFKNFSTSNNNVRLSDDDLRFLNSHTQRRQRDFIDTKMDPEGTLCFSTF